MCSPSCFAVLFFPSSWISARSSRCCLHPTDMIASLGSPVVAVLVLLTSCFCLHTWVLWKAPLEELHSVFPVLLSVQETSTETRCKTFQLGVESHLGTFNQSLRSSGIQGCVNNIGVMAVLPRVATSSPRRGWRKMLQMLSHTVGGNEVHHCCKPSILFSSSLSYILAKVRNKAFSPFHCKYLSYSLKTIKLFKNDVFCHHTKPFCTVTFINTGLNLCLCREWCGIQWQNSSSDD